MDDVVILIGSALARVLMSDMGGKGAGHGKVSNELMLAGAFEGDDASQFGIGMASASIAEIILRDERAVMLHQPEHTEY